MRFDSSLADVPKDLCSGGPFNDKYTACRCQAVRPDHSMFAPSLVRMRTPKANRTQGYFTHHVGCQKWPPPTPHLLCFNLHCRVWAFRVSVLCFVSSVWSSWPRLQFCAVRAPAGNRSDDSDFVMRYLVPNVHRPTHACGCSHTVYILAGSHFPL